MVERLSSVYTDQSSRDKMQWGMMPASWFTVLNKERKCHNGGEEEGKTRRSLS